MVTQFRTAAAPVLTSKVKMMSGIVGSRGGRRKEEKEVRREEGE